MLGGANWGGAALRVEFAKMRVEKKRCISVMYFVKKIEEFYLTFEGDISENCFSRLRKGQGVSRETERRGSKTGTTGVML